MNTVMAIEGCMKGQEVIPFEKYNCGSKTHTSLVQYDDNGKIIGESIYEKYDKQSSMGNMFSALAAFSFLGLMGFVLFKTFRG